MQRGKLFVISIFCGILILFSMASLILPHKDYSAAENRSLADRPELSLPEIRDGSFQESYEEYLSDQMLWRDGWVRLASVLEHAAGRLDINGVYVGQDGYLLERYEVSDFDQDQMDENITYLSGFLNRMTELYGKENVTCMMVPSKTDVLSNRMPRFAKAGTAGADGIRLLSDELQDPDILLDPGEALAEHREEYIYYRTDHHWTTLGAYYAYRAWAEKTGRHVRPLDEYTRETVFHDFYGSTYNKLPLSVPRDTVELFHSPAEKGITVDIDRGEIVSDTPYFAKKAENAFRRYDVFFSKNAAQITVQTEAKTGRKLLLVKDSFANCFAPFLLESFDEIVMVDCRYIKRSVGDVITDNEGITDVLVLYNTERFLQETSLRPLDAGSVKDTMEEFNADDFFDELQ